MKISLIAFERKDLNFDPKSDEAWLKVNDEKE